MFLLKLISRIPLRALYFFSDFLFIISYYVLRYRKAMVLKNLENSFPEKTLIERKKICKSFYRNLCDYAVETLKLLTISEGELKKRMVYKNPEILRPFKERNESVFLMASHQFNWEWLLALGTVELPLPHVDFVYQEQGSELFDNFSLAGRTRFGAYAIKRQQVAREVVKRKNILRGIAIVADQFPGHSNDKKYWTVFLNQRTAFFQSINQLIVLTQYPVFYSAITKTKRGYYEVELIQLSKPPYESGSTIAIEAYIKATEKLIHQQPDGWLWSHNRWKQRD